MADRTDADAPRPSDPFPPPEWCAEQWPTLCEVLDTDDPTQVVPRVKTLKKQLDKIDADNSNEGLITISEVEAVLQDMNGQLEKLRERNAALVEQMEGESESGVQNAFKQLHRETEQLLDALGVTNVDEAHERVRSLNKQLDNLYREKEVLLEAGFSDSEEALEALDALRSERDALAEERDAQAHARDQLQRERDRLQTERDQLQMQRNQLESERNTLRERQANAEAGAREERDRLQQELDALKDRHRSLVDRHQRLAEERERVVQERNQIRAEQTRLSNEVASLRSSKPDTSIFQAASIIRQTIGVTTPEEAHALVHDVRQMQRQVQALLQTEPDAPDLTAPVDGDDDVRATLQRMEEALTLLRKRRDHTDDRPSIDGTSMPDDVARELGVSSAQDARELADLVRRMGTRLDALTREQKKIQDVTGLTSADDALAMIRSMEAQLDDLYAERDAEHASNATQDDATQDDAIPAEIGEVLGVTSVQEAKELESLVHSMTQQLESFTEQQEKLDRAGLTVDTAIEMIDTMEEQLVELYDAYGDADLEDAAPSGSGHDAPVPSASVAPASQFTAHFESLIDVLGVSTPDEAEALDASVRALNDQLRTLVEKQNRVLEATGVDTVDSVVDMVHSMEAQLVDLYQARESSPDAEARLANIKDVLGIENRAEAEELATIARDMELQLNNLYADREKLEAVGVNSVGDAVEMIDSMEEQLVELYQNQEAVDERATVDLDPEQDTFQQLQALYAEREKLERELGVSSATEIIEMVEGLATQLDEFYARRDIDTPSGVGAEASASPTDALHDADALSPGDGAAAPPASGDTATEPPVDAAPALMLRSMHQQLEALYREKDVLLSHGIAGTREAMSHIETLQEQVHALQKEVSVAQKHFDRLDHALGTHDADRIIQTVRRLRQQVQQTDSQEPVPSGDAKASPPSSDDTVAAPRDGLYIDAAPAFVPDDTLDALDTMTPEALEALDCGVVRLDDQGNIEYVSETGLALPDLDADDDAAALVGKNLFFELIPSTNNNLFFGRFRDGVRQGAMDARFPYTFISPGRGPTVFVVHLYRSRDGDANWLLFQRM